MPRAGAVPALWVVIAVLVVAVGGFWIGSRFGPGKVSPAAVQTPPVAPTPVEWSILDPRAQLAERCRAADSEFDTDPSHWSTEYEFKRGVKVTIVPHKESNQHSLATLAAGKLVAKFVNSGGVAFPKLALPANGMSCLFVQSATQGGGVLTARAIASGGEMDTVFTEFHIDFHRTVHRTPLARWYDGNNRRADPRALTALPTLFRLPELPAVAQDSTGGSGPGAWTTCASNGCCRVGGLFQ